MKYLKCDVCPFWNMDGCTVTTLEQADMVSDEMWCQHRDDDKEKLED